MDASKPAGSIFSQKLDRVAFTAYFLGAVVPLVALAVVAERFVMPTLSDRLATFGLMGAISSIAVLSLASFLVLRRTTRRSLGQMDRDNDRLASLLTAAGSLTQANDEHETGETVARAAVSLCGATAVYLVMRGEPGRPPHPVGSAGEDAEKLYRDREDELLEVSNLVLSEGQPVLREPSAGGLAAAAVPVPGEPLSMGLLLALRSGAKAGFAPEEVEPLTTLAGFASVAIHNVDLRDSQRNFFTHVTELLVQALDTHLGYHAGHSQRVAQYANRIGRTLGLDEHRLQRLHFGALLHDIGMLKFDRTFKKTAQSCQKHAQLGARMLNRIRVWQEIGPIVLNHHEWYDGSGYPEGNKGESIPLESRIIAACDAFDSMTSEQSYKVAVSPEAALRELERNAGTQFDPKVVQAFQELAARGGLEVPDHSV